MDTVDRTIFRNDIIDFIGIHVNPPPVLTAIECQS